MRRACKVLQRAVQGYSQGHKDGLLKAYSYQKPYLTPGGSATSRPSSVNNLWKGFNGAPFTNPASRGARAYYNQSWRRRRNFIPEIPEQTALYGLMSANVAVFLLWRANPLFAMRNFTTSLDNIKSGRLHTLLTCTFSQRDTWHLLSNMIGLYFFGRSCAHVLGGGGLVMLYLAGGAFGSLIFVTGQAWQSSSSSRDPFDRYYAAKFESTPALGSSGAINSIVMFDIMMAPTATVLIYGILPMHAWILGGLFLYQDINGALGHGRTDIGYTVHLAGTAIGALAFWGVRRGKIPTQWRRW